MFKGAIAFVILLTGFTIWQAASDKYEDPNSLLIVEVNSSADRTGLLRAQLDQFENENPGISVDVISLSWGQAFEKLAIMVAGGQIPDVIEMPDFWYARYAYSGQLADLNQFMDKSEFGDNILGDTFEYGSINEKLYTIPYGYYLRALIYNPKLFDQAGLEEPPKTLDEFYHAAAELSKLDQVSGYCHHGGRGGPVFYYYLMNTMNGENKFFEEDGTSTFYQEGAIKGLTMIRDIYQNGYAPQDSLNWNLNDTVSGFYSGTCAMLHQTPDALPALRKRMNEGEFASTPMPLGPNGNSFPHLGYIGWSIFEESTKKEKAWKLVRHLLSYEKNKEWTERAGLVSIYTDLSENYFGADPVGQGWLQTMQDDKWDYMINPNHLPEMANFDSIDVVQSGQAMMLGQKTPEETAKMWADFLTEAQKKWLKENSRDD